MERAITGVSETPADGTAGRGPARRVVIVGGLAAFLLMAAAVVWLMPPNMDEMLPFHVLACRTHPASVLNSFREPCDGSYLLHGPFGLTVQRAYGYVGGLSSFLYAPFHAAAPGLVTQYLVGLGWLGLFAALLSRLSSRPGLAFWLTLSFFPFVYQFTHDTGPIRVAAVAFPAAALLVRAVAGRGRMLQGIGGALTGVLFTLALEDKPFFVYLLPAAVIFAATGLVAPAAASRPSSAEEWRTVLRRAVNAWPFGLGFAIVFAIGAALVLFSTTPDGRFYLDALRRSRQALPTRYILDLNIGYLVAWSSFAHRVYDVPPKTILTLLQVATVAFYAASAAAAVMWMGRALLSVRIVLLGACFAALAVVFLATGNVWAGHHAVFLLIPLVAILIEIVAAAPRRAATALTAAYLGLGVVSAAAVFSRAPQIQSSPERDRIIAAVNRDEVAEGSIVNHSAWGIYYIHALYAPRSALVVYTEPLVEKDARAILDIARRTGRRTLYQTCFGPDCTAPALDAAFGGAVSFREVPLGTRDWRLFTAMVVP